MAHTLIHNGNAGCGFIGGSTGLPTQPPRQEDSKVFVIEQQYSQRQDEIIEKSVVAGDDDANLQRRHQPEQRDAKSPRQHCHPDKHKFQRQRESRCP